MQKANKSTINNNTVLIISISERYFNSMPFGQNQIMRSEQLIAIVTQSSQHTHARSHSHSFFRSKIAIKLGL